MTCKGRHFIIKDVNEYQFFQGRCVVCFRIQTFGLA
ncbi:MAG: hypothetical protein ACI4N8_01125 [Megasphaera sp.]